MLFFFKKNSRKFTEKVDELALASARDAVDTDTNSKEWKELPREYRRRKEGEPESDRYILFFYVGIHAVHIPKLRKQRKTML